MNVPDLGVFKGSGWPSMADAPSNSMGWPPPAPHHCWCCYRRENATAPLNLAEFVQTFMDAYKPPRQGLVRFKHG